MFEDWIDVLLSGAHDISLPALGVSGGGVDGLSGSGRVNWRRGEGIRLHGVTDGAEALRSQIFGGRFGGTPGQLIPHAEFLTFTGRDRYGWDVTTDAATLDGYHVHSDLPHAVWDLTVTGVTITREGERGKGHMLRLLVGPAPSGWTRFTHTSVDNEYFGGTSSNSDWMLTETRFGRVATQRRSDDWVEVKVIFNPDQKPHDPSVIGGAIARALGFLLGRRCAIQGHEYLCGGKTVRRIDSRFPKPTEHHIRAPLGWQLTFTQHVESLFGRAVDFFLTELGERVAAYLFLCWDAADNAFQTQLAVGSICLEGLLRVAAETLGPTAVGGLDADLDGFGKWLKLKENPIGLSAAFVKRLGGIPGMFRHLGPKDILRDWIDRGVLGVTDDDYRAWNDTRQPLAHGRLPPRGEAQPELQSRIDKFARVQNLINKIVLRLIGYRGEYVDYSRRGYPPAPFPGTEQQGGTPVPDSPVAL